MKAKRSIADIKCPKCGKNPIAFHEIGTVSATYFLRDTKITSHTLNPGDFLPIWVDAVCGCGHSWRLKKVSSIEDIKEKEDYDEVEDNQLSKNFYNKDAKW